MKTRLFQHPARSEWPDRVVVSIARRYRVSREVVLRRLVDVGMATPAFYRQMREQYESEAGGKARPSTGRLPRSVDVYSQLGRRYVGTMLAALDTCSITQSDFSSYVGLRLKHLPRLRASCSSCSQTCSRLALDSQWTHPLSSSSLTVIHAMCSRLYGNTWSRS